MNDLKYGVNPHDNANCNLKNIPNNDLFNNLSLNSLLDIIVGINCLKKSKNNVVYLKHGLPIFSFLYTDINDFKRKFKLYSEVNRAFEFGTFCFSEHIDSYLVDVIKDYRFHNIFTSEISEEARIIIKSDAFQEHNRGVTIIDESELFEVAGNSIELNFSIGELEVKTNISKSVIDDKYFYLDWIRTIGGIIINPEDNSLVTARSGGLSPTQSLGELVGICNEINENFKSLDIATDACFGVESPYIELSKANNVGKLTLFGSKNTNSDTLKNRSASDIEINILPERRFTYFL